MAQTATRKYVSGAYELKPIQGYIREEMSRGIQHIIFRAPLSYGKTATGLATAFRDWEFGKMRGEGVRPWLIIAPSSVVDVWTKEAQSMFGPRIFSAKSLDSPLIAMNKSDVHRTLTPENLSPFTFAILISTNTRTNYRWLVQDCDLILDEAHKHHNCKDWIRDDRSVLLLSASPFGKNVNDIKFRLISVPDSCVIEKVPTPIFRIVPTPGNEVTLSAMGERGADPVYIDYTLALLAQLPKRVVIFCPGNLMDDLLQRLTQHLGIYRPILKFSKSTKVLVKAAQIPNSVIVISHAVSEGINVVCDDVIVIRGDWLNKERINQLLGRCLRTINPNKFVTFHQLVPHGIPRLLTLYTNACLTYRLHLKQETANVDLLTSGFRLMMLLDPNLEKTTPADIIAIVNMAKLPPKEMLDWWKDKKSGYNPELQAKIIKLPFYS